MAACKEVSDMESLQLLMTCGICLDMLKKPVLFPCIHHFCKECKYQLKQEVQDGITGVLCPTCRRFTDHDSIKDDFVMEQIVDLHTKASEDLAGNDCCELCLKEKPEVKCLECKMKLCQACKTMHLRQPFARGHTLKDLNEVKNDKMIDAVVFCSEHSDKVIEFSCVKCDKAICYKCKILHHDGHKTETVEDAIGRLMSNVHKKLEPVDSEIETLQQKIKHLDDTDQLTSSWENNTIAEINNHKLELIRKIEIDAEGLIEEVRATAVAKKKEIIIEKTDAEHLLSSKESTRSWVNTMVSHLGDVNLLLQLQGDVMATLNKPQVKQHVEVISAWAEIFSKCEIATDKNCVGNFKRLPPEETARWEKKFESSTQKHCYENQITKKTQREIPCIKPDFKIPKAGEGFENSELKKMVVLEKKVEEKESDEEDEEYESVEKDRHGKKLITHLIDISFYYNPARRGGGRGRGERGGPRSYLGGYRGRFGSRERNNRSNEPAPHVQDDREFPSLGS